MSVTETTESASPATKPLRDVRGYWRVTLAVIAPLPMLAMAGYNLLTPSPGDATFAEAVAAIEDHQQLASGIQWLSALFVITLIPATVAVAMAARRGAPRLTTVGATLSLLGFLAGFGLIRGGDELALVTVREGLDRDTMARLADVLENSPASLIGGTLFILGLTIGLLLLGLALWRSKAAPAWMGIALMVGTFTHPFIPSQIGIAVGLAVAAVGFAGASVALLGMRNDEFDLPAVRRG